MLKPKKSVEKMSGYFVPLYEKHWDVKIDSNENNYGPSPKVIEALKKCDYNNISFYPYYGELSKKIADFYGFDINNIKVTNGADEALQGIVQTYLETGEALLTLDISFEMPVIYTQIQGGNVIKIQFETKWEFPLKNFLSAMDNPSVKIIYIAAPNNPTGNLICESDLKQIIEKSKGKAVIIDETYANYANNTYKEYAKLYDNVFIVRSFSKDFALAGLRLGCIISNEENINNLKKVISPFSVNSFAIAAGNSALDDVEYFYGIREEIIKSKEDLKEFFTSLGAVVYDSCANFLLVDFKEKADFVYNKLKKENITVKLFGKNTPLKNHLRITIPTTKGVEKLKKALKIKPYLVFDMDGVLVDASNSFRIAVAKTYEKFSGKEISQDRIQEAKNLGGLNNDWDLTKYLLSESGLNISYNDIVEEFQKIYWNDKKGLINDEKPLFNKELFVKLSENYNLAIFTGRYNQETYYTLERFNAADLFYPVLTSDDIPEGMGKPDPIGLNLLKKMTLSDRYYYFGDTKDDIKAAKKAGYIPIGVLPPQDKSEELCNMLKSEGAEFILQSINDVKTITEQKNEAVL